jgi:hypothetical protein
MSPSFSSSLSDARQNARFSLQGTPPFCHCHTTDRHNEPNNTTNPPTRPSLPSFLLLAAARHARRLAAPARPASLSLPLRGFLSPRAPEVSAAGPVAGAGTAWRRSHGRTDCGCEEIHAKSRCRPSQRVPHHGFPSPFAPDAPSLGDADGGVGRRTARDRRCRRLPADRPPALPPGGAATGGRPRRRPPAHRSPRAVAVPPAGARGGPPPRRQGSRRRAERRRRRRRKRGRRGLRRAGGAARRGGGRSLQYVLEFPQDAVGIGVRARRLPLRVPPSVRLAEARASLPTGSLSVRRCDGASHREGEGGRQRASERRRAPPAAAPRATGARRGERRPRRLREERTPT